MKPSSTLVRKWSWKTGTEYYSPELDMYFRKKEDFWFYLGRESWKDHRPSSKVEGFSLTDVIKGWLKSHGTGKPCVVLYDINVEIKRPAFWLKIPRDRFIELTKEVVLLNCDSMQEMEDVISAIDPSFACALGFSSEGVLLYQNFGEQI